jgi:glutamate racemase
VRTDAHVTQIACQVFVALAEEGWSEGEAVDAVTARYLAHLDARVDTVVLGCTHFPLLAGAIKAELGRQLGVTRVVVDSAATTARATAALLAEHSLASERSGEGSLHLMATDSPERFARVGARFLGSSIAARTVEAIDL